MTSTATYFDRKPSSSVRPGLSHLQPDPSSPHTPQRQFSSTFSSPSVSFRAEEEAIIFELGNRHLSAGFAGESCPRCKIAFGLEEFRKVGDYRRWLPGYGERIRKRMRLDTWGEDHELWRMDLRGFDLGTVEDKVERAVREAYNKYLLLDSKVRKVYLVLPSVLPHQLLNTVMHTLFENFQMPSITLLSPPILSTVAAGCRSGLVVDVGWRETIVTAVYDFREVYQYRTIRGMWMLTRDMARMLERSERQSRQHSVARKTVEENNQGDGTVSVDLEQAEEATARMAWCRPRPMMLRESSTGITSSEDVCVLSIQESSSSEGGAMPSSSVDEIKFTTMPSPCFPRRGLQIPFTAFANVVDDALFAEPDDIWNLDDHEQPLPRLIFNSLLSLPPDARSLCMSRMIFVGGGSNIPGLKPRIIEELATMVKERGWNPVCGKAADQRRRRLQETSGNRKAREPIESEIPAASMAPQVHDQIDENLRLEREKHTAPTVSGMVRGVESLGAWVGGSLLASLRIKGIVEVEKDTFLQYGLAGAKRESEVSALPQRKSYGADIPRMGISDKTSWTLGAWA
ncbi:MAG: hypothetical protein Q9164_005626 [Protoblastenia rupestris]